MFRLSADTAFLPARMPADTLTGVRMLPRGVQLGAGVLPVASDVIPSLTHLGVLADATSAQPLSPDVPEGHGVRTLGLRLQLARAPRAGEWVRGKGEKLSFNGTHGLTRSSLCRADGTLLAVVTGRFMTVRADIDHTEPSERERFGELHVPACWDGAYGLGEPVSGDGTARIPALPSQQTRNNAPIMHGGLHLRAAELVMRAAAGLPDQGGQFELADIDALFHNPVPVDGSTRLVLHGKLERRSRRVLLVEGRIETQEGTLLTVAHGTFLPVTGG